MVAGLLLGGRLSSAAIVNRPRSYRTEQALGKPTGRAGIILPHMNFTYSSPAPACSYIVSISESDPRGCARRKYSGTLRRIHTVCLPSSRLRPMAELFDEISIAVR